MSILIKGLKIPTHEPMLFCLHPNGDFYDENANKYEVIEIQGRLVDADALVKAAVEDESHDVWGAYAREVIVHKIQNAPTIIPAEEAHNG